MLKVGDIVVFDEVCYYDVDVIVFGYEYGQFSGCLVGFKVDEKLVVVVESCIKVLDFNVVCGFIVSGDVFINGFVGLVKICYNFLQVIVVEMEVIVIVYVCYNFKVFFVVVCVIFDVVDQQFYFSFEEFFVVVVRQFILMVENLVQNLVCG